MKEKKQIEKATFTQGISSFDFPLENKQYDEIIENLKYLKALSKVILWPYFYRQMFFKNYRKILLFYLAGFDSLFMFNTEHSPFENNTFLSKLILPSIPNSLYLSIRILKFYVLISF